jgi:hypothetical protein
LKIIYFYRQSPFGVCPPNGFEAKLEENNPGDYKLDSFTTVQQRHTYFQRSKSALNRKRHIRLRARQVLCHRCKSVCNENGRNVQRSKDHRGLRPFSKKTKNRASMFNDLCVKTFTLVPRLKRLGENEIRKFNLSSGTGSSSDDDPGYNNSSTETTKIIEFMPLKIRFTNYDKLAVADVAVNEISPEENKKQNEPKIEVSEHSGVTKKEEEGLTGVEDDLEQEKPPEEEKEEELDQNPTRILRKKRSVIGSMEDLWDETIFIEEPNLIIEQPSPAAAETSTILKISLGNRSSETLMMKSDTIADDEAKATKKALKRARKEARKLTKDKRSKHKKHKKTKNTEHEKKSSKIHSAAAASNILVDDSICDGDVIWARHSSRDIWWPAKVIKDN